MHSSLHGLAMLCCALLSACTVHVFSPPTGAPRVESSATIGKGQYAAQGDVQLGSATWGPSLSSYRVTVAHGITPKLDLSLSPSLIWIHAPEPGNPHGGIYGLRVGVKYAPVRFVAFSSGLAPGGSAGGSYLAHDAGITLGGENPYLVPFLGFHGLLSLPIKARTVRILHTDDDEDEEYEGETRGPDVYFRKPLFTSGWQLLLGLKLPLSHDLKSKVRPSLGCAVGLTMLYTKRSADMFGTFGCAMETTF